MRKNNWKPDRNDYWARSQDEIRLDKLDPGRGYRHLVTINQLRAVIHMLPDWDEVAIGLDAIALAPGRSPVEGLYFTGFGVIDICAWPRRLWDHAAVASHVAAHRELLDRLGVDYRRNHHGYEIRWTEAQARAYQLLHILPHELGHHHDLITSSRKRSIGRGESYAEEYANRALDELWPLYVNKFDV
ncbi:MAG: hypothetical protein JO168_21000 [Solirubrobacterales bacterium]|nr:hypothetical protein [Solirubrobacterales bacterium]